MEHSVVAPNPGMIFPFVALLAAIALGPLIAADAWSKHYPKIALALGAVTLTYYLIGFSGDQRALAHHRVMETAIEYLKFIALVGSLFVVSGGIHINVKGEATPFVNVIFLLIGAIVANLLGTTGASMLLIRPWIRMNKYRITAHHIVFFILIVSNVGGCLTPIGDPPLFLGYIKGVPFWWVAERCWPMWAVGIGFLLGVFLVIDLYNFSQAPKAVRQRETAHEEWRFQGLSNVFFLGVILCAVFIKNPPFLREALMVIAAAGSYFTTKRSVHEVNHFNFHPIKEVAILFVAIFATMMPALDWLAGNAQTLLGQNPPVAFFYWCSGMLSSVLDNAPTYLSFLTASFGTFVSPDVIAQVQAHVASGTMDPASITGEHAEQVRQTLAVLQQYHAADVGAKNVSVDQIAIASLIGNAGYSKYIVAISVASVFFGANTYIGNGPNFMVKAIADHQKVHTPTFVGYVVKFALPIMLPMLALIWLLFFRG